MSLRINLIKASSYVTTKLAGAGFLLVVFASYLLIASGLDLVEFVEGISNGYLFAVIYIYGILCALIIDLIVFKFSITNQLLKVLFYIFAGFGIFIVISINLAIAIIAGTIGAISALLFYTGSLISLRSMRFKVAFSFILPLIIIFLTDVDFTKKVNWTEEKSASSYTATFDYFNGKHEIPILVKAGQTLTFTYDFEASNDDGHGFHVLNKKNKLVGMTQVSEREMRLNVQDAGIYRVVVTGDSVSGGFKITWDLSNTQ